MTIIDPEQKPRRGRELSARLKSAFAVLLALAVLGGGIWFVQDKAGDVIAGLQLAPDFEGTGKQEVIVTIASGSSTTDIGDQLVSAGVVKSTAAFLNAVKDSPEAVSIQAGTYRLKAELPAGEALKLLLDPATQLRNFVTVPEGYRLTQQLQVISEKTKIPMAELEAAAKNTQALGLPAYAKSAEGFLFPNTYEYSPDAEAIDILKPMVQQYTVTANGIQLTQRAEGLRRTPYEVVTIASIIEREVARAEDRPKVSRVIYNRLAKGMMLQMDSTVHYAVNDYQTVTTTDAQRASNSPFNTYKVKGLPPGPISAPGEAALDAASSPEPGDWIYFVTVNLETGETRFAATDEEHNANVALFQQWCQANPGKGC